ncbi:MAG TPA: class II aldolase/adducin family protein [Candidatus Megaira endosymbiont of Hartmannula sinica]|nr:class II aldolase/adducin family protein [Candidatus Megaera endosymbiont of Hartmannula sinica]
MDIKKDLAIAYRTLSRLKMDDHTYTHLSVRSVQDKNNFYIYPFGMLFEEMIYKDLLKVSLNGDIMEGEEYQYNQTGYTIHGSIYSKRNDVNVIFHLHTEATVAISSIKEGLMPISQWALHFYEQINYHDYNSLTIKREEHEDRLVNDLGNKKILFLRNHGFIVCTNTIHEAMYYCYHLEKACKTQIMTLAMNKEIIKPPHEICKKSYIDINSFEQDLGKRDWLAWKRIDEKYMDSKN